MQPQVNLLSCLPAKKQVLSAYHILIITLIVFSGLFSVSMWQWMNVISQKNKLSQAAKKNQEVELSVNKLRAEHPIIAKYKSLPKQIALLTAQLTNEKTRYEQLSQRMLESGFAMYLKLLAQKVDPNVQLEAIFISHVKQNLALYGQSRSAQDVSHMVEQLYLSPLLKGMSFSQYVMAQKSGNITFEVATQQLVNQSKVLKNTFLQGELHKKLLFENNR